MRCLHADAFAQFIRCDRSVQSGIIDQPLHHFRASDLKNIEPHPVWRQAFGSLLIIQRQNCARCVKVRDIMKSTENQEKSQKEGYNLNTPLPEFTGSSAHAAFPSDHNSV